MDYKKTNAPTNTVTRNVMELCNETGNIYEADIKDLQERLDEIWEDMKEVLVHLASIQ